MAPARPDGLRVEKDVVKTLADSSYREAGQLGKLVGQQPAHQRLVERNFRIGPGHVNDDTAPRSMALKRSSRQSSTGSGVRSRAAEMMGQWQSARRPSRDVPGILLTESRSTYVGQASVRRALPTRGRRTVGAWCFVDHIGPASFSPENRYDVAPHPHIGLQTVTWLFDGAIVHRDSLGSEQLISPGQLNLMTSGEGIAHSEENPGHHLGRIARRAALGRATERDTSRRFCLRASRGPPHVRCASRRGHHPYWSTP